MSSPKQLLVSCITLLCLEQRPDSPASGSNELINDILSGLEHKETVVDFEHGKTTFNELKKYVAELNTKTKNSFPDIVEILQALQVICREETYLYDAIVTGVKEEFPDGMAIMRRVTAYRQSLNGYLRDEKAKAILKEYSHKLLFNNANVDMASMIREMGDRLEPYVKSTGVTKHPAEVGTIDFDDPDNVEATFDSVKETLSNEGIMKTGWKAFNRMLGPADGFRRGEFVLTAGLQHNFKSGLLMCLLVHICLFNRPFLKDPTKKPLILFVTLENELQDNLLTIYKYIKENETGEEVNISDIDANEAAQYVCGRLEENGFRVRMVRFDPTEFTIAAFVNYLDGIMAEGYEIPILFIDYLNMLSKAGIDTKIAGDDVRLLFRRLRNYSSSRQITVCTPHQLSSEALQLTRDGVEDFVKQVANRGYYDGCRRLGQEPDLEIMSHIVEFKGQSYLTFARGKHRNTVTPKDDQYFILPFSPIGTIPWDIDKEGDISMQIIPGLNIGAGLDDDVWDL